VTEFTGERVIPGEVNEDLWAEHMARYAFASRYTAGKRVLDLGCGTGYGTAQMAQQAALTVGIDLAHEAVAYASDHYAAHYATARFVAGSATALPFPPSSFDVVTAFEVIEHLSDWSSLLAEARRVLCPGGLLIVSTPNKSYYAEARGKSGPNPFHEHEFEFAEFRSALNSVFPQVTIFLQNRLEAFAFHSQAFAPEAEAYLAPSADVPAEANFFVAVCSISQIGKAGAFVYVPRTSNLLGEREKHIRLLETELTQVKNWLQETIADRNELIERYKDLEVQLEASNRWALQAEGNWKTTDRTIVELQAHLEERNRWAMRLETHWNSARERITQLQEHLEARHHWAIELEANWRAAQERLGEVQTQLEERTQWALDLDVRGKAARDRLVEVQAQLEERTRWALELEAKGRVSQERVVQLQQDFQAEQERAVAAIASLTDENLRKTHWALDTVEKLANITRHSEEVHAALAARTEQAEHLEAELAARTQRVHRLETELAESQTQLNQADATIVERTERSVRLAAHLQQVDAEVEMMRQSRWTKLGRLFGLGPDLTHVRREDP